MSFKNLPNDIWNLIFTMSDLLILEKLSQLKTFSKSLQQSLQIQIKQRKRVEFLKPFPSCILNAFEKYGIDIFEFPEVDLKGRTGSTDYIDFVKPKDLNGHCFGRFRDAFSRNGISFAIRFRNLKNNRLHENIISVFQRYTDFTEKWSYGTPTLCFERLLDYDPKYFEPPYMFNQYFFEQLVEKYIKAPNQPFIEWN